MVARKNYNVLGVIFFDKRNILINSVCRTLVPLCAADSLVRRKNVNAAVDSVKVPRLSVSEIVVENKRLILGEHAYGVNTAVNAV